MSLSVRMAMQQRTTVAGLAIGVLALSNAYLSSRYYKSAAFERPFHFSITALLLSGLALHAYARYFLGFVSKERSQIWPNVATISSELPALAGKLKFWLRLKPPSATFALLLLGIVTRTVLHWRIIRTVHCSWDGLQAFLPLLLAICDNLDLRSTYLPRQAQETGARTTTPRHAIVALVWGLAATDTLLHAGRDTGAICPAGWCVERLVPLAQLTALAFDASLMSLVGRLRQSNEDQSSTCHSLGTLFTTSAGVLAFIAAWSSVDRINLQWNLFLTGLAVRDLLFDSVAVAVAMLSGIHLLGSFTAHVVGLLTVAINMFVYIQWRIADGTMMEVWSSWWGFATGAATFLGFGVLLSLSRPAPAAHPPSHQDSPASRNRYVFGAGVVFILVLCQTVFTGRQGKATPELLIVDARSGSDSWVARAAKSTTLTTAVEEYRKRYGVPPPPNFDKWYEFATSVDSPIIDTFDQIHSDLLPYWGTLPSVLRERTSHILEHPSLSIGGLVVVDGKVEISPLVPGTHRWMLSFIQSMVEPFAAWLPNMHLAFNLDDECRISVPFDRMRAYTEEALVVRARLGGKKDLLPFSKTQNPPWAQQFMDADENIWEQRSPWFIPISKSPIFYEWISSTCPADSAVNNYHWWNRKAECRGCASPHMTAGFLSNWTLAGDLCHQPDLAYLHGFLSAPSAMNPSHTLFPVFSQSRVQNFADILYPSPWNFGDKVTYEEEKDVPWAQKLNSVFWRGASSDGFAAHGAWQMFLRARFVYKAMKTNASLRAGSLLRLVSSRGDLASFNSAKSTLISGQTVVNVSFVGNFARCDDRDCTAEHTTFYGSPTAEPAPPIDFQDSWRHRHLVDLDGAAFSGRFLPFLNSTSLPYRAALFRTWWEERVHAWRHYIPLDVRLGDLWTAVDYLGSGPGSADAEEIAEAGRAWAQKAMRKEDMQVYMFRLLLEWGRIVDDRREDLGFAL
ncbi:Uu.00g036780.m01.CDS01 [Anthostomella pinea]|uniref:Uu.00g036780.m01.CDS01 n=1 Tax=Anthostomella pinea TaxID=933095 RepID=A0AAI8V9H1_9PEZI|nr:Uu.00g036780.m01.CDS01 [Anthostomella pinea]